MKKRRTYIRNNDHQFQPYQVCLIGVGIIIAIQILITILILGLKQFSILNPLILILLKIKIVLFLLLLILSILTLILNRHREQVAHFELKIMTHEQVKYSKKIRKLFTHKQIIDVLNLSNQTRYGDEIPNIEVWINDDLTSGFIAIENIGNFNKLDRMKLEQNISGIFSGAFQKYAIISSKLNKGDNYMIFNFEDASKTKRFYIKNNNFSKYTSDYPHKIRLSEDLIWNTDLTPHLSCIARTRSGKSVLMGRYVAKIMQLQNWYVEYNSVKLDRYVKEFGGCFKPESIIERAEYWCEQMDKRLNIIHNAGKDTYLEVPEIRNIGLFFDEIGNLNGQLEGNRELKRRWESAINRLTATGASCGIHVIAISQFGTKESFLPSTARANCSDAVIMLGSAADSPGERQFLIPGFADLPTRNYGVGEGVARFNSSGEQWMTPHHFEAPWFINDDDEDS